MALNPAFEQTIPISQRYRPQKQASHPRALQREGRRDFYVEEWGLTVEHELPSEFPGLGAIFGKSWNAAILSRGRESLHRSRYV